MMTFEEFADTAAQQIRDYLPAEYAASEVTLPRIRKINQSYTGLVVRKNRQQFTPAIRLDLFYQDLLNGSELEDVLQEMGNMIRQISFPAQYGELCEKLLSGDRIVSRLFVRICGRKGNEELLGRAPHQTFLDLAVTCHVYLGETDGGKASILVSRDMLRQWGMTEAQLFEQAFRNSASLMPPVIRPMREILAENCLPDDAPAPEDVPLYVITRRVWGSAAALFYPGVPEQLSGIAGGSYFILPSSVNECIMVPESIHADSASLRKMVREINRNVVEDAEILSDNIYYYDKAKKELTIAE